MQLLTRNRDGMHRFAKAPAIYHVSGGEGAEVEVSSDSDSISYYVNLRLNVGGRAIEKIMDVDHDRLHMTGGGKKQCQVVEAVNRWVGEWRDARAEENQEDANV